MKRDIPAWIVLTNHQHAFPMIFHRAYWIRTQ